MQTYARHLKGFHVLPVYGGQNMGLQLRQLARGVHVVVGTPGRILDHLRRGTLKLDRLASVVLDEADEMLRMGFIDDVEADPRADPAERQVALFSATMPEEVRQVARRHLKDPVEVRIKSKTTTVETISQRYWQVNGLHKLDALTRILEVEEFDAMLVFVRTKIATVELAEKLEARGFSCAALNGDMNQALRERTVERLKARAPRHPRRHRRRGPRPRRGRASATWSTTTSPTTPRPTSIASAAPDGPAARARRSCSSRRASGACCAPSSRPPASRSRR